MQHQLFSDQLSVLIKSKGAEICSIKNPNGLEYIWTGDKEVWGRHAPVLFPIVGKLKDNSFIFNETRYNLNQHGFARDLDFTVVEKSNVSCVFNLSSTTETKKLYPFDFDFNISYELKGNKLFCRYKIKNPSDSLLLFSVGAHPGFNCPLEVHENFEDYFLEFEKPDFNQTTLSDGLRSGQKKLQVKDNKLFLSQALFNNDALVFENNQVNKVRFCSSGSSHQITLECEGWPYFGVWAKKDTSKFICLEPWYGIADGVHTGGDFTQKAGIISLEPLQEFNCSFSIQVD